MSSTNYIAKIVGLVLSIIIWSPHFAVGQIVTDPRIIKEQEAVFGWIFAKICHKQTGKFAEDLAYFTGKSSFGRSIIYNPERRKYHRQRFDTVERRFAFDLSKKHPKYKVTLCRKEIGSWRRRVK